MSSTEEDVSAVVPQETEPTDDEPNLRDLEKIEEEKFKEKYPCGMRIPGGGHSAFLQKRLQKGQKFFDSGDYQMAKQRGDGVEPGFPNTKSTGETIPTPETVPVRKISIIQPCNKLP